MEIENSTVTQIDNRYTYVGDANGIPDGPYNLGSVTTATNFVRKGGPVPHYRGIIAAGGNATTHLYGRRYSVRSTPTSLRHDSYGANTANQGWHFSIELQGNLLSAGSVLNLNIDNLASTNARNQAATRYLSELASVESAFKGQVFAGELPEMLRAIRSPAKALREGVSDYLSHLKRHGVRFDPRNRRSFVRDTWLEYSFGWRPLVNDIDSAITAFNRSSVKGPTFQMVKASGRDRQGGQPVDNSLIDVGYGRYVSSRTVQETEVFVKYYGIYRSRGNGISTDVHSYGFSPWEFVPTLWELIPYSFLVDYFTNIGAIVSSWSYRFLGSDWVAQTVVKKHTSTNHGVKVFLHPSAYPWNDPTWYTGTTNGDPGMQSITLTEVERTPSVTLPIPSLELQVPGMGSTKWLNLLALSNQLESTRGALRS